MRARWVCVALLCALACASPERRIAKSQETFDGYPPEVQETIRQGRIAVGFTPEQVRMALGEPDRKSVVTSEDAAAEIWTWRKSKPGVGIGIGSGSWGRHGGVGTGVTLGKGATSEDEMVVEFVNGRVARFESLVED